MAAFCGFLMAAVILVLVLNDAPNSLLVLYQPYYVPENDIWMDHLYYDVRIILQFLFLLSAILAAIWFSYVVHKSVIKGVRRVLPWWLPGALMGASRCMAEYMSCIADSIYSTSEPEHILHFVGSTMYLPPLQKAALLLLPTGMFVYVCWLLWRDYMHLISAATPNVDMAHQASQYASTGALPTPPSSGQNALGTAPASVPKPAKAPSPGVTCPQCGGRVPTVGRTSGMVFCKSCGASITIGAKAGEINDAMREQLAALKQMREDDLITQEEYEAKKRQLLGL